MNKIFYFAKKIMFSKKSSFYFISYTFILMSFVLILIYSLKAYNIKIHENEKNRREMILKYFTIKEGRFSLFYNEREIGYISIKFENDYYLITANIQIEEKGKNIQIDLNNCLFEEKTDLHDNPYLIYSDVDYRYLIRPKVPRNDYTTASYYNSLDFLHQGQNKLELNLCDKYDLKQYDGNIDIYTVSFVFFQ